MTEDFSLAALGPIDKTEAPEVSDPRLALPEAVQVPFANSCVSSAVVSEMTERLNASTVELPQRGSNTRLFLEQLREMAQAHLIDLARAAASIRDEIDALTRTMSQRREAVWAAAVPVRGRIPGEEAQSGVAAEVVDSELDTVESLTLPLAKEPMIRRGILSVCLETPYELIGQLAAVLLTMRSEEFALGIVSIEHGAVGTGKLDLSVDLASIDVTPRDGVIPPMALRVVVREHPTASERNAWGNVKRGHPSSKRGGAGG